MPLRKTNALHTFQLATLRRVTTTSITKSINTHTHTHTHLISHELALTMRVCKWQLKKINGFYVSRDIKGFPRTSTSINKIAIFNEQHIYVCFNKKRTHKQEARAQQGHIERKDTRKKKIHKQEAASHLRSKVVLLNKKTKKKMKK